MLAMPPTSASVGKRFCLPPYLPHGDDLFLAMSGWSSHLRLCCRRMQDGVTFLVCEPELSRSMLFDLQSLWICKEPISIAKELQKLSAHRFSVRTEKCHIFLSAHSNPLHEMSVNIEPVGNKPQNTLKCKDSSGGTLQVSTWL